MVSPCSDLLDNSSGFETLQRLHMWKELLDKEESDAMHSSTAAQRELRERLLHAIKHPGNKKGN